MTLPVSSGSKSSDDTDVAAKQLEAYFIRQVLADMPSSGLLGGDGVAGSTFRGMFEEILADTMAETGQLGLGQSLAASLDASGPRKADGELAASLMPLDVGDGGGLSHDDPQEFVDVTTREMLIAKPSAQSVDSIVGVE